MLKHWTGVFDETDATQYDPDPFVGVAAFAINGRASVIPPIKVMTPNSFESILKFFILGNLFRWIDCCPTASHSLYVSLLSPSMLSIQNCCQVALQFFLGFGKPNFAHVEEVPGKTPAVPFGIVQTTRLGIG